VSTTVTPEDDIVLAPGQSVERVIFGGGHVFSPVTFRFAANATGGAQLAGTLFAKGLPDATTTQLATASATLAASTTTSQQQMVFDYSSFKEASEPNVTISNVRTNPGDVFIIRIAAVTGTVRIETNPAAVTASAGQVTRVDFTSGQSKVVPFEVEPTGPSSYLLEESIAADEIDTTTQSQTIANMFVREGGSFTTGRGQATPITVQVVNVSQTGIPNVTVAFLAPTSTTPGTQTAVTNQDGIATRTFTWTTTATSANLDVKAINPSTGATTFTGPSVFIQIVTGTVNLPITQDHFEITTGVSPTATVSVDLSRVLVAANIAGGTTGKTTVPTSVEYFFGESVSGGARWAHTTFARVVEGASPTQTASFRIRVLDGVGSTTLALSDPISVDSALRQFAGTLTELSTTSIFLFPGSATDDAFQVRYELLTGPGIAIVSDEGARSFVVAPGPVVFANSAAGRYLVSQPDPRQ
jgi:hypothetical protein